MRFSSLSGGNRYYCWSSAPVSVTSHRSWYFLSPPHVVCPHTYTGQDSAEYSRVTFCRLSRVLSLFSSLYSVLQILAALVSPDFQLCNLNSGSLLGFSRILPPCVFARTSLKTISWDNHRLTSFAS